MTNDITMIIRCTDCGAVTKVTVPCKAYRLWKRGLLTTRKAFSHLTESEYDTVYSHLCKDCYGEVLTDFLEWCETDSSDMFASLDEMYADYIESQEYNKHQGLTEMDLHYLTLCNFNDAIGF